MKQAVCVNTCGCEIRGPGRRPWFSRDLDTYEDLGWALLGLIIVGLLAVATGLASWHLDYESVSLPLVLVIGLVAGVSTCAAVTGGLVIGLAARFADAHPEATPWRRFRPHLVFNAGRLAGYALFGALLGAFGGVFRLSTVTAALLAAAIGLVMLVLGLKLTRLSPRLDGAMVSLPAALARRLGVTRPVAGYRDATAALSGALTFFLPCGFTQAMQLYAIGTGSAARGAAVMAVFALGTAPSLLGLAGLVAAVRGLAARRFFAAVGLLLLVIGGYGAWHGVDTVRLALQPRVAPVDLSGALMEREVQVIRMEQRGDGYFPSEFAVKRGRPVRWIITSRNEFTCASSIVIPQLGITRDLRRGENVIEFTPTDDVDLSFACSMGMFKGHIQVVD